MKFESLKYVKSYTLDLAKTRYWKPSIPGFKMPETRVADIKVELCDFLKETGILFLFYILFLRLGGDSDPDFWTKYSVARSEYRKQHKEPILEYIPCKPIN
jgi:hypothetical protein